MKILLALGLLLATISLSQAATEKHNVGCGKGSIFIPCNTPPPSPINPVSGNDTVTILTKASSVSNVIVADLQSADSIAGAINPATGKPYDALGHLCFPAAINFIQTLPAPGSLPTPTGSGGLITTFEEGRITALAAQSAIINIANAGYPDSLKMACDPWLLDNAVQATNTTVLITAFIAKFIPK